MNSFIPESFKIPTLFKTKHFRIRPLKITDVIKDYDAVMSSIEDLEGVFGPNHKWPYHELILEQDLIDLGWHHKEFQKKSSFTYTVMNLDESECLGCIYIYPCSKQKYDTEVYMWVRASANEKGLDSILFNTVNNWLQKDWPFESIAYPRREVSWDEWDKIE